MEISKSVIDPQSVRAYSTLSDAFYKRHGDYYDYSKFIFYGVAIKSLIMCPVHGEFLQSPKEHRSYGCKECGIIASATSKRKNTEWFIEEAVKTHGTRYSYNLSEYKDCTTKIRITCIDHGEFLQTPYHLTGSGCQVCTKYRRLRHWLDLPTILYYVTIIKDTQTLHKIGITTKSVEQRFRCELKLGYKVIIRKTRKFSTGKIAYTLEQHLLGEFKGYRYIGKPFLYRGMGDSELLTEDVINELSIIDRTED